MFTPADLASPALAFDRGDRRYVSLKHRLLSMTGRPVSGLGRSRAEIGQDEDPHRGGQRQQAALVFDGDANFVQGPMLTPADFLQPFPHRHLKPQAGAPIAERYITVSKGTHGIPIHRTRVKVLVER